MNHNQQQFVYATYIRTTPEKLWAALTTPEFTRQYWSGNNVSDWKRGSKWQHLSEDKDPIVRVTGEVLESQPPKRLVLSWAAPQDPADVSRATFEIEPIADLVRLVVTHDDFQPNSPMVAKVSGGWPLVLSNLKSLLETGKAFDIYAIKGGSCDRPDRK